jgi:hypothetical protein
MLYQACDFEPTLLNAVAREIEQHFHCGPAMAWECAVAACSACTEWMDKHHPTPQPMDH